MEALDFQPDVLRVGGPVSEQNWQNMTYDEQRAVLGLPDVRAQVGWYRLGLAVRLVAGSIRQIGAAYTRAQVQADYGLAK